MAGSGKATCCREDLSSALPVFVLRIRRKYSAFIFQFLTLFVSGQITHDTIHELPEERKMNQLHIAKNRTTVIRLTRDHPVNYLILAGVIILLMVFACTAQPAAAAAEEPASGSIHVWTRPVNAYVCVDETDCKGTTYVGFAEFSELSADTDHTLSVSVHGHHPYSRTLSVSPGQTTYLFVTMSPYRG